jgi:uncharacterized membrane protein
MSLVKEKQKRTKIKAKKGHNNSQWKTVLKMISNPSEVVKNQMAQVPWPFSIFISGLSFALFFLQTGIDLYRVGEIGIDRIILIAIIGLFYGTVGVALIAILSWVLSRASNRSYTIGWAVSNFALGYSATLIYSLCGLFFSLAFNWKTAVAFGVTGVLWALRPTMSTIKQMSGDKVGFSIALTTICGAILMFGWGLLGQVGM